MEAIDSSLPTCDQWSNRTREKGKCATWAIQRLMQRCPMITEEVLEQRAPSAMAAYRRRGHGQSVRNGDDKAFAVTLEGVEEIGEEWRDAL